MDDELRVFLVAMESRLTTGMANSAADLKADLKAELKANFEAWVEILRREMDEKLLSLETKLLTEFWKWGRNADTRIRRVELSDGTTTERMASLEDRVFTLERKVAGSKS